MWCHQWAFLSLLSFAEGYLYQQSSWVVDLDGRFPWDVDSKASQCPVIFEWYASWCPHCRAYASTYAGFAQRVAQASPPLPYIIAGSDCYQFADFCNANKIWEYPSVADYATGSAPLARQDLDIMKIHDAEYMWQRIQNGSAQFRATHSKEQIEECVRIRYQLAQMNKHGHGPTEDIPHPNHVWLPDQKRALYQAIGADAVRLGTFSWNRTLLPFLRAFVSLAAQAFPDSSIRSRLVHETVPFLEKVIAQSNGDDDASRWSSSIKWLEPQVDAEGHEFFGCRGSEPNKRGYTCALWQLFHGLLVNYRQTASVVPHAGLAAIHDWISIFFGCEECREHFVRMSAEMAWRSASSDSEAILFMWRAHNRVNRRIAGDSTEDPAWPKLQFPPSSLCSACWHQGSPSDKDVLRFLRKFYAEGAQLTSENAAAIVNKSVLTQWGALLLAGSLGVMMALVVRHAMRSPFGKTNSRTAPFLSGYDS